MNEMELEWKVIPCGTDKPGYPPCWCRVIVTTEYKPGDNSLENERHCIIGSASINEEIANHIVELHNEALKKK